MTQVAISVDELQAYVSLIGELSAIGMQVGGKLKDLVKLFRPGQTQLTDEQIDAIEAAGIADSQARLEARQEMAKA